MSDDELKTAVASSSDPPVSEENLHSLTEILDHMVAHTSGEQVTLRAVMQSLGTNSYGPILALVALISMTPPISVLPGLAFVTASFFVVISVQLLVLRPYPWLPDKILRFSFSRERLVSAANRARPWTQRLGRVFGPRLQFLLRPPFVNCIAFICFMLGILTFVLSPLPAGENIPAAAVLFFGLALTAKDGLLALVGLIIAGVSVALTVYYWPDLIDALSNITFGSINGAVNEWIDQLAAWGGVAPNVIVAMGMILAGLLVGSVVRLIRMLFSKPRQDEVKRGLGSLLTWWVIFGILTGIAWLGKPAAVGFFALLSLLGLREFQRLTRQRVPAWGWAFAYLALPIQYLAAYYGRLELFWTAIPIGVLCALLASLVIAGRIHDFSETAGTLFLGMMLNIYLLGHAVLLFALPESVNPKTGAIGLFLYLVVLTESNDIAQSLWGRMLGSRKILPAVSPGKTWEGFLLGVITTTILACIFAEWLTPLSGHRYRIGSQVLEVPFLVPLSAGLLIAVGGFFGDVTMSAIKREVGVKDSGTLLPGQGGVLDRIDSLTFTAPLFFYFIYVVFGSR